MISQPVESTRQRPSTPNKNDNHTYETPVICSSAPVLPGYVRYDDQGQVIEHQPDTLCPELMTEQEVVRFLRLTDQADPRQTLARYRHEGLLRGTRVGKRIRYLREEVMDFLKKVTEEKRC